MVVFGNQRLGAAVELVVSNDVAAAMLQESADAMRSRAEARWEHELVRWLDERAAAVRRSVTTSAIDVSEIAWTRDHFDSQRRFVVEALARATLGSEHGPALERWRQMIAAHPEGSVQLARRWAWMTTV